MNAKHTPGTWSIDGLHIVGNGYSIAHINSHRTTEGRANAHLIAAAPELLEALEAARDELESCIDGMNDIDDCQRTRARINRIDAVIAKATGA